MNIVITGCSGFVGSFVARHFLDRGETVTGIGKSLLHSRLDEQRFTWISADTKMPGKWQQSISNADLVVNLAGANIFNRWSDAYKADIRESRIQTTQNLVAAISPDRKTTLFSASAVGFYGNRGEESLVETSGAGEDFLAKVCVDWESAAAAASQRAARVVIMRFGVVLGNGGGALGKMVPAFKAFLGGPLGRGSHWFPWVHITDIARAMDFCLQNQAVEGPINLCAPGSVRQGEFAANLGRVLHRPAIMPAPSWVIRLMMGEMGGALLASARAVPERLARTGFEFQFPTVESALTDLLA